MTTLGRGRVSPAPQRAGWRDVFTVSEFRALWVSYVLSAGGDRLALVALTLLVYDRTRSPLLAAITYGSSTAPYLIGGLALSGLADRLPRRAVLVACDLLRTVLVAVMVWPRLPMGALIGLLYLVTAAQPPFDAARSAILRDILDGERYTAGAAVMQMTFRVMLVGGAAAGGATVTLIGSRPALGVDAATFLASAVLIRSFLRFRPAAAGPASRNPMGSGGGIRLVFGNPTLRTVMLLGCLAAFYDVPGALAAPYAASLGGGAVATGLLIASGQLSAVLAAPLYTRIRPVRRQSWMGVMAVGACGTLALTALGPDLATAMAIFAVSGIFGLYQVTANTVFVESAPAGHRGKALGVAATGLVAGQGLAFGAAGWAAEHTAPAIVLALSGGLGALLACALAARWRIILTDASRQRAPAHAGPLVEH